MSRSITHRIQAIALLAAMMVGTAEAATVTNLTVAQRPGTKLVDISYDVTSCVTNAVTVSVVVSNATGVVSASHITGNVGSGVATGTCRKIVWDGGADQNGQNLSNLRVWLAASDGNGSTQSPSGMVSIPSGSFLMGNASYAPPKHTVQLSAFYMDQTLVTKCTWDAVTTWSATNGYDLGANSAAGKATNHPAQKMTWHNAVKWCNARSARDGLTPCYTNADGTLFTTGSAFAGGCNWSANGYRLPTESEWEYAARGTGTTNCFPWLDSNTIQHSRANYWSDPTTYSFDTSPTSGYNPAFTNGSMPYTSPVGSFAPNAYGLYDMAGNVCEWCWDWYSGLYPTTPLLNPRGSLTGQARVIRGGSWGGADAVSVPYYCFVDYRWNSAPDGPADTQGFRCVKAAPSSAGATPVVSGSFTGDFRDYILTVTSAYGTPTPPAGNTCYAWCATVTCSVQCVVCGVGTNWSCAGWAGNGSVPATGNVANTGALLLTNQSSSIVWQWCVSATAPAILAQPQSCTNCYNTTAVLSVVATGLPCVVYQWRNGTNLINGSRINGVTSNTLTIANAQMSDAGNYTVVVSNAMGSVTSQVAVLTVQKASASVVLSGLGPVYNGTPQSPGVATAPSGLTICLTYNGGANLPLNAGSYLVVGTINDANFAGGATATMVIAQAPLTVTADPISRPYNTTNPPLTATFAGFVNGETAATAVTGAPSLSTTATQASGVGVYPIAVAPGTLSAANYSFGFANGCLTVNKACQNIYFSALPQKTTQDPPMPLCATTSSGLPITYSSANQAVALISSNVAVIGCPGSSAINAVQSGNANYLPAQSAQTLVVVPAPGFDTWAYAQSVTNTPLRSAFAQLNSNGVPNGLVYAFGTNLVQGIPLLSIRTINGQPVVEIPQQDATTLAYVTVQIQGSTNLLDGANGWTLPVGPATDVPGTPPTGRAWFDAINGAPNQAFFKLAVSLN